MTGYDYDRPFIDEQAFGNYVAADKEVARRYGRIVKATGLSNVEYRIRFQKLRKARNMKLPPSAGKIFPGFLVVRNMGLPEQYETWMPEHVFEELYNQA